MTRSAARRLQKCTIYATSTSESRFRTVPDGGQWKGAYKEDSYKAKPWKWNELKGKIPSYSIPEGKLEDYWWYSTKAITPIETSYVYRLSDSTELPLENYDIYLALKDKPKPVELPCDGTFITKAGGGHTLELNGSGYNYDETDYTCIQVKKWLEGSTNNGYAVLLTDGTSNYASYLQHYFEKDYFHVRPPKLYQESSLPDKSDFSIMNSLIKNFTKQ